MTQRNIHRNENAHARNAVRTISRLQAERANLLIANVAIASLILVVVVLITTPSGAG